MNFLLNIFLLLTAWMPLQDQSDPLVRLKEKHSALQTIQAEFKQERRSPMFEQALSSRGLFYFVAPDRIRWEETQPKPTALIITQDKVIQYEGENRKVSNGRNAQLTVFRRLIVSMLDGSILDDPKFEKKVIEKGGKLTVELRPVDARMSKMMEKIEMVFDANALLLNRLILFEDQENLTTIDFSNHRVNEQIPDSKFN